MRRSVSSDKIRNIQKEKTKRNNKIRTEELDYFLSDEREIETFEEFSSKNIKGLRHDS